MEPKHWPEDISIHAPVKGATRIFVPGREVAVISIHAPVKGATQYPLYVVEPKHYFNPRSRKGSDREKPSVLLNYH